MLWLKLRRKTIPMYLCLYAIFTSHIFKPAVARSDLFMKINHLLKCRGVLSVRDGMKTS